MSERTAEDEAGAPSAAFLDLVLNSAEVGAFLRSVMDDMMEGLAGSGRGIGWAITLVRAGITGTWAADSARTAAFDRLQHSFEDGPALAAIRCNEFVHSGDTSLERRWPGYGNAAAGYGVLSLLSVPLIPDGVFAATVNLYSPLRHSFTSTDIMTARNCTRQGMRGLHLALALSGTKESSAARIPGSGSRDLVGSALRILMDEYRLSYEAALHYLHTAARSRSVGLEQAALEIVAAGPQPGSHPESYDATSAPSVPALKTAFTGGDLSGTGGAA